jgi:hypothetical protein
MAFRVHKQDMRECRVISFCSFDMRKSLPYIRFCLNARRAFGSSPARCCSIAPSRLHVTGSISNDVLGIFRVINYE